ncbi:DUF3159 domain-containing protein [Conexibacter sp. JD483]|uniref:DUF3159 domain-containing protein n=1 Tax=unclassified Conexibacter TaxID=2627773 RepID=UPI00271F8BC8|nr:MULTISPECIES: DUF3159 domain-containing protein [unclassified Conexibacter]MDO8188883.1 DUF3159 domain-containing protein [Conexibacter sp. CPCC 205706]MDO8201673.1 DUF3159 domain-containing protein [Conexibacter sp. CPCC 205762]MDR9372135.1 DUF3159 domain-containing protein [Conexibacter sp. JD483]
MSDEIHDPRREAVAAATRAPTAGAAFAEALGGPLGIVESALPAAAFVIAYTLGKLEPTQAAIVAVAISVVMAAARLARKQTVQYALSGLLGIAISAFIVSRTGKAEDFFLPGLLLNIGYVIALAGSILLRWPIAGVALGAVAGSGMGWRDDPRRVRIYSHVTWIWVGVFALRLAVQLPLYIASAVVALGVAKVAMGLPLFAVGMWLSWLVLRQEGALHAEDEAEAERERQAEPDADAAAPR